MASVQFIKYDFPREEDVGTSSRDKPTVNSTDLAAIIHFHLTCDEAPIAHERLQIQAIFAMQVMAYTAVRPGSIMEPYYHLGTNNGLLYKDVEVTLVRLDGSLKIMQIYLSSNHPNPANWHAPRRIKR